METQPARHLIPELIAAEAALQAHADLLPAYDAPRRVYLAWSAEHDQLARVRDAAHRRASSLLCSRCGGTGATQFKHRFGGTCFQCKGDGWSAKGRRQHKAAVA